MPDIIQQTQPTNIRNTICSTLNMYAPVMSFFHNHETMKICHQTSDIWRLTSGIWHLTSVIWHLAFDIWNQPSDIWHLTSAIWHLTSDIWHLTSSIWHPPFEIWHLTSDKCSYKTNNLWSFGYMYATKSNLNKHMIHFWIHFIKYARVLFGKMCI